MAQNIDTLVSAPILYAFLLVYAFFFCKTGCIKVVISNFETLKYHIGTSVFFFMNINVLFFCALCNHCHIMCIPFTMSGVLIGAVVYLSHLEKKTVQAIKNIIAGKEFDLMAPFFSIPYFVLIANIFKATLKTGLDSLHQLENKMLIVLLYPFFVVIGELTCSIRKAKLQSGNKGLGKVRLSK